MILRRISLSSLPLPWVTPPFFGFFGDDMGEEGNTNNNI